MFKAKAHGPLSFWSLAILLYISGRLLPTIPPMIASVWVCSSFDPDACAEAPYCERDASIAPRDYISVDTAAV